MNQKDANKTYLIRSIITELKAILDGCDTIIDALPFCNAYISKYPEMKNMILGYTNGKIYRDTIDIKTKQSILNDVMLCDTKDDAYNLIHRIADRTNDDIYKKAMNRIANRKSYTNFMKVHDKHISKSCPHCGHVMTMPENTTYVICGYGNTNLGYDLNGCGKDWCFQCNKLLCKSWDRDQLFLHTNRKHDEYCCANHAKQNNITYADNYCQCTNIYVYRVSFDILDMFDICDNLMTE